MFKLALTALIVVLLSAIGALSGEVSPEAVRTQLWEHASAQVSVKQFLRNLQRSDLGKLKIVTRGDISLIREPQARKAAESSYVLACDIAVEMTNVIALVEEKNRDEYRSAVCALIAIQQNLHQSGALGNLLLGDALSRATSVLLIKRAVMVADDNVDDLCDVNLALSEERIRLAAKSMTHGSKVAGLSSASSVDILTSMCSSNVAATIVPGGGPASAIWRAECDRGMTGILSWKRNMETSSVHATVFNLAVSGDFARWAVILAALPDDCVRPLDTSRISEYVSCPRVREVMAMPRLRSLATNSEFKKHEIQYLIKEARSTDHGNLDSLLWAYIGVGPVMARSDNCD